MKRPHLGFHLMGLLGVALIGLLGLSVAFLEHPDSAGAVPLAQATPTCPARPTQCLQDRVYGYQPPRQTVQPIFNEAARNNLGANAPTYMQIARGIPPSYGGSGITYEPVSSPRPLPHPILRAMGWQESRWKQFANDKDTDPDGAYFCTFLPANCGYGLMQITSGMGGGSGFEPSRVASELTYNLGTGTYLLMDKWNWMSRPTVRLIGSNDHTVPESWYYAVTAYNMWNECNDPNRGFRIEECPDGQKGPFYPDRPPYGEANYGTYQYPYQEVVGGWTGHPENNHVGLWLWRSTRISWVPRGIWGLSGSWRPPEWTPKPVFHLLPGIRVANGAGPTIVLRNPTGRTLAADVALYNSDHTFNRWWLGAPLNPDHVYPYRYIRLDPGATRSLPLTQVFDSSDVFVGYARISASTGVEVALQAPPYPHKVFIPIVLNCYGGNCSNGVVNGGFEEFIDGKPFYWDASSAEAYPLADGTWFASGHYGAYLGGYRCNGLSRGAGCGLSPGQRTERRAQGSARAPGGSGGG